MLEMIDIPGWCDLKIIKQPVMSIYYGETWKAYEPGQDEVFHSNYVARRKGNELTACVGTKEDLMACAKSCQVDLKWITKKKSLVTRRIDLTL